MQDAAIHHDQTDGTMVSPVSWRWILGLGVFKLVLAGLALSLPLLTGQSLASLVGIILALGGLAELGFGVRCNRSSLRSLTLLSGGATVIAGAMFLMSEFNGLLQLTTIIATWLVARGLVSLDIGLRARRDFANDWIWVISRGIADLGLGLLMWVGIPISMLPILLFGESATLIAPFGIILAISFFVASVSLIAISLEHRKHRAAT